MLKCEQDEWCVNGNIGVDESNLLNYEMIEHCIYQKQVAFDGAKVVYC